MRSSVVYLGTPSIKLIYLPSILWSNMTRYIHMRMALERFYFVYMERSTVLIGFFNHIDLPSSQLALEVRGDVAIGCRLHPAAGLVAGHVPPQGRVVVRTRDAWSSWCRVICSCVARNACTWANSCLQRRPLHVSAWCVFHSLPLVSFFASKCYCVFSLLCVWHFSFIAGLK